MHFKKILLRLSTVSIGIILGLLIGEACLRIYNPIKVRIKGDEIRLLTNFKRKIKLSTESPINQLDSEFNYSTNNIGLRGPDLPKQLDTSFKIFTVGGSTTECSILDDLKTWPKHLEQLLILVNKNIWLNNAGIDGTSTFGHLILLNEHLIQYRPDMIIFLVGINDLYKATINSEDNFLQNGKEYRLRALMNKSELFLFLLNYYRTLKQKEFNVGHILTDQLKKERSAAEMERTARLHRNNQKQYQRRLEKLMTLCIENNIRPILVTQPIYDLSPHDIIADIGLYNQTTKEVGDSLNLQVIDLANRLENNGDFYYDQMHFTKLGAERVANIIFKEIKDSAN